MPPLHTYKGLTEQQVLYYAAHPHYIGWLARKTKLTQMHSDWINYLWGSYDAKEHRALQAHRGSYKTTAMAACGIIRHMMFHPDDRGAIIRKTITDAAEVMKMIDGIMKMPEIRELFYYVLGGVLPRTTVNRREKITYNFKHTNTSEGTLNAHGLDASLTGKHYDWIWLDDFETLKDRTSRAVREATKEIVREILTNIIDPGKPVMLTGTPWHRNAAWSIIEPILPQPIAKYPVEVTGILSPEEIEQKEKITTPFLFAANYRLNLMTQEGTMFHDPVYGTFDVLASGTYAHLDAAYDGDHTCALTIMTKRPDDFYQAKGWIYAGNVKDWLPFIAKICKQYRVKILFNELNADKGYTADKLRQMGCAVSTYDEKQNKTIKISTHLYYVWKRIIWDEDTDAEYMTQILDWAEGIEPDDAPDSAASIIRQVWGAVELGNDALYKM